MRMLNLTELERVGGGKMMMTRRIEDGHVRTTSVVGPPINTSLDPTTDPDYWMNNFTTQLGAPPGSASTGVTLTPAESAGLDDVEAAQLIGWIETLGAFTDPATALESDAGITGFSAVQLEKTTMAMKMYCTDHDEGWEPGPQGSPGVCTK